MADDDPRTVQDALTDLYDAALAVSKGYPEDANRYARDYEVLVRFIADAQMPDPAGVEPERLIAAGRLLLHSGDITPYGVILLERIAQEVQ